MVSFYNFRRTTCLASMAAILAGSALMGQQTDSIRAGATVIGPADLPPILAGALQNLGGRMTTTAASSVNITGTVNDERGTRTAQLTIQAPGYLSYREGQSRSITFDGTQFRSNSGGDSDNQPTMESLLAHFPDMIFLQIASGGGWRRVGSHFRTDNGKTPNYSGPYWTIFGFSPAARSGVRKGQALQQTLYVAFDEQTWLMSEVRVAMAGPGGQETVTQTQFSKWFNQSGQWYPGEIVRLENGKQTLSFQVTQASVGAALPASAFQIQ
jgi:hypothetical protein